MDTPLLSPPAIVGRVVQFANDPESSVADLGGVISQDPSISVRVLRAVNSAFYGLQREITSVDHAVGFMGQRAVRNLVLCVALKQAVVSEDVAAFPLERFWLCSLRRAVAARCLAQRLESVRPDDLFTIGLCQDFAVLAMLLGDSSMCEAFAETLSQPSPERLGFERSRAGEGHDELGHSLFAEWGLPAEFYEPIRYHHSPEAAPPEFRRHAEVAHAAEVLADFFEVADDRKAEAEAEARAALELLGLDPDALPDLIDEVGGGVAEAASMLEMTVGQQPSYAEVAAAAAEGLAELNRSYEASQRELTQVADRLQAEKEELEKRVFIDELTGLPNRRAFDDQFARALAESERQQTLLSLLVVDVDHFKRFNDTYGHQAGDFVLQQLGAVLRGVIRESDFAARYGGEEFVMVLPATDREGGRVAAERIRESLAGLRAEWEGAQLQITASIGGVTLVGTRDKRAAIHAIRAADDALYEAKESGRNRVCWSD